MTAREGLRGSVVVVTGAARGIGADLCRYLAARGAAVVAADVLDAGPLATELTGGGADALAARADVTDDGSLAALVAATLDRYGRIDALVNNAGLYADLGAKTPFTEIDPGQWDRVMAVNVGGVWRATKAVHPVMKQQGYGRVVNIASSTVHMGVPFFAHYTASKGAVIALTRSIAREVGADGITVNAIAPGLVETDATRSLNDDDYLAAAAARRAVPRRMTAADLGPTVAFLCSPESGFVTGQTHVVDGGTVFS